MTVEFYKRKITYTDKDGKKKRGVNFYVKCGDQLISVTPTFIPNPKCDNRDPKYAGRKAVLEAFAETLPDIPKKNVQKQTPTEEAPPLTDDDDLPF